MKAVLIFLFGTATLSFALDVEEYKTLVGTNDQFVAYLLVRPPSPKNAELIQHLAKHACFTRHTWKLKPEYGPELQLRLLTPWLGGWPGWNAQTLVVTDTNRQVMVWKEVGGQPMMISAALEKQNDKPVLAITCVHRHTQRRGTYRYGIAPDSIEQVGDVVWDDYGYEYLQYLERMHWIARESKTRLSRKPTDAPLTENELMDLRVDYAILLKQKRAFFDSGNSKPSNVPPEALPLWRDVAKELPTEPAESKVATLTASELIKLMRVEVEKAPSEAEVFAVEKKYKEGAFQR